MTMNYFLLFLKMSTQAQKHPIEHHKNDKSSFYTSFGVGS